MFSCKTCPADTGWHVVQRVSAVLSTNIKAAKPLPMARTGAGYLVILVSVVLLSHWSRDLRGAGLSAANRSQRFGWILQRQLRGGPVASRHGRRRVPGVMCY